MSTNTSSVPAAVAPPTASIAPPTASTAPPTASIAPPTAPVAPPTAIPVSVPVINGDTKVPLSSKGEDEEEEVEYEDEEVEVDEEEYEDEDYEIEEIEVDDEEEDLEEPTEADAEELEDDEVANDEFDRVGSKIDELLAKTGNLQQQTAQNGASLASKVITANQNETETLIPKPSSESVKNPISEISASKLLQSSAPSPKEEEETVEDEEEVEYVYEDEEEEEEAEIVVQTPSKPTETEVKLKLEPEPIPEEPIKIVPQVVFKPKVPEVVQEEEEEDDEEVEYVYEDEEEEEEVEMEEEAPPAGNLLRHASNNWNICDLNDETGICLQKPDGSSVALPSPSPSTTTTSIVLVPEKSVPSQSIDQTEERRPETATVTVQPIVIQPDVEEEEEDIEEIEIALEEGMEEDDDDDEVDEQMPDNLLRDPSSSINSPKSSAMDHYQIDLPPMSPSPTPHSPTTSQQQQPPPGFGAPIRQTRSPSPSSHRRSLSPASQVLSRVRNLVLLGQLDPLRKLLDSTPNFFIDAILKAGWTALMYGSYRGYPSIVDFCLRRGSDPNYHKEFFTSLMAVCTSVCADEAQLLLCMKLLLGYGARVNAVDKFGCSPLHYAARFGRAQLIRCLLNYGANLNHTNQNGWSALHWAAAENQTDAIGELLEHQIDVHLCTNNPEQMTASQLAAMKKNFEVAEALAEMEQEDLVAKQLLKQNQQQQHQESKPNLDTTPSDEQSTDDDKQFKLKQAKIDSIISEAFQSAGNRFTKIQEEEEEGEGATEAEEEKKEEPKTVVSVAKEEPCEAVETPTITTFGPSTNLLAANISADKSAEKEVEASIENRPYSFSDSDPIDLSNIVTQMEPSFESGPWSRDSIQLDESPLIGQQQQSPQPFFTTTAGHLVLTCILFVLLRFLYSKLFTTTESK